MANDTTPPAPGGADSPDATSVAVSSKFGAQDQRVAVAAQLANNTVQVDPGGQTFSTISAAIASINDAGPGNEYLVSAGPGTYNEQVTLKPYVYLQGAGVLQTNVSYPPVTGDNFMNRGVIIGASNSAVSNLTATCLGGSWGDWSTALMVFNSSFFSANGVSLVCDDGGNAGINIETIAVNWNAPSYGATQLYIYYCVAQANMSGNDSVGLALMANGSTTVVEGISSKFAASGGLQSYGASSNGGASVTLDDCYAQGATFALNIPDGASTLIANNCQIDGPVGSGVQVNNNNPPATGGD